MLDDYGRWALTAVPSEVLGPRVEEWFEFVVQNAADEDQNIRSWDDFAEAARSAPEADNLVQALEIFSEVMVQESAAWPGIAEQLLNEGAANLTVAYDEAAQASPYEGGSAQDPDEVWSQLLIQGGDWSAWDGSQEHLDQLREWFFGVAASAGEGAETLAHDQLDPMAGLSVQEHVAALSERGFTIEEPSTTEAAPAAEADADQLWAQLLEAGGDWSDWDGTNEHWEQMASWFYSVAEPYGEGAVEDARQRLEPARALPVNETIATMRAQGFTLDFEGSAIQEQAEAAVSELLEDDIDSIMAGALATVNLDPAVADDLKPLLRERLEDAAKSQPEIFANLNDDQKQALQVQLATELEAELHSVLEEAS